MSKQEEIREVIDAYADDECLYPDRSCESHGLNTSSYKGYCISADGSYRCLMQRLAGLGVVIKVDDQTIMVNLPSDGKNTGLKVPYHLSNLGKNIVAVEPLIGG